MPRPSEPPSIRTLDSGVRILTTTWKRMRPPASFDTLTPVTSGASAPSQPGSAEAEVSTHAEAKRQQARETEHAPRRHGGRSESDDPRQRSRPKPPAGH